MNQSVRFSNQHATLHEGDCLLPAAANHILLERASGWGLLAALLGGPHLKHPSVSPVYIRSHKPPRGRRDWAHRLMGYWDSKPQEQS